MPAKYKTFSYQALCGFTCDKCGAEYGEEDWEMEEMIHWRDTGGYFSLWGDGTTWELVLCPACAYDMFKEYATIVGDE